MRYIVLLFISFIYLQADAHIFVYHRFAEVKHPTTSTSLEELKKEFEYFKTHNYKVVPIEKIISKVKHKETIPDNWIALTIDDAYKSFYTNGLKIFKQYHYPFSLYVYVEATNRHFKDFMSWKELKEASKYGTINLHSYSHPHLTNISKEQIIKDTQKSIEIFTKKMGFKPTIYAYPYGEYNSKVQNALKVFNFDAILNQSIGSINKNTNLQNIPRIALVGEVNIKHKLRYNSFDIQWIEPLQYPKDGILKSVKAKVNPKYKKLKLYVTGLGWKDIKVKNGIIDEILNFNLVKSRTRIMLGQDVFTISTKILIKGR